ncbi:MAG TPA: ATPase, T2SS/T4P/T4SS family [Actinomycetota bacterium]|jgi:type IV pilus assembly protein PilB|nr:ATPase, T2SS/T4P/T4SS family [Actinomycetota bacterium]
MTTTKRKTKQLGQILIEQGLIDDEQLERALEEHRQTPKSLGRVLIDLGLIKESDLVKALAEQVGLEFVDLADYPVDATLTTLLPDSLARRYRAIPIGERDGRLLVAMSDPANVYALDDIRTITGRDVQPIVATASDVEQAIQKYSHMDGQVEALATEAAELLGEDDLELSAAVEEAPIVRLVTAIMTQAVGDRASDVHIEPTEKDVRIRFRVDGVLHEVMHSPKNIQGGLISRLKVMADLNIAEKRVPQDGRISMRVGGKQLDLRLATLPTVHGEKVVIRVLDKSQALMRLEDLGFQEESFKQYQSSFKKPYGAILVTGPTGSGKSTTMYATLNILNQEDKNIITVEDPVEYRLAGVNQIQVNPKAGLSFASALRSILRADPDIVLVGEVRDRETAMIAVEAALTGHLVLSSLHTNDAASAVTRLTEMGVETFLVASAIDCIVAQRLARKLCERCREAYRPDQAELSEAGFPESQWGDITELYRPVGCAACANTGYRGRFGLYEVMRVTEELERLTVDRASSDALKAVAIQQGMVTLREDGLEKTRLGLSSIEEVARVVK